MCAFNDDIQGTACITLAGLLSAARATGKPLSEHRVLFLGAGEAGTGIGELVATYMHLRRGCSVEEGRRHCFFLDSKGLVCSSRSNLQHHKQPFAHDVPFCSDLKAAIKALRPTALVGVSTIAGAFDREVVEAMCELNERPIIFPLSNPTSKSECSFEDAFKCVGAAAYRVTQSCTPAQLMEGDAAHTPLPPPKQQHAHEHNHITTLLGATLCKHPGFLAAHKPLCAPLTPPPRSPLPRPPRPASLLCATALQLEQRPRAVCIWLTL